MLTFADLSPSAAETFGVFGAVIHRENNKKHYMNLCLIFGSGSHIPVSILTVTIRNTKIGSQHRGLFSRKTYSYRHML